MYLATGQLFPKLDSTKSRAHYNGHATLHNLTVEICLASNYFTTWTVSSPMRYSKNELEAFRTYCLGTYVFAFLPHTVHVAVRRHTLGAG